MALYCAQGSGIICQQLLMMHGIAWYCMALHGIVLYCMVLHGIAWYCMALHGIKCFKKLSKEEKETSKIPLLLLDHHSNRCRLKDKMANTPESNDVVGQIFQLNNPNNSLGKKKKLQNSLIYC